MGQTWGGGIGVEGASSPAGSVGPKGVSMLHDAYNWYMAVAMGDEWFQGITVNMGESLCIGWRFSERTGR